MKIKEKDGCINEFWSRIFAALSMISIFSIVKRYKKSITYTFIEGWVIGNLIFAFIATLIGYFVGNRIKWLMYFLVGYGMLRVFEVITYQLNVLFFDAYRAEKKGMFRHYHCELFISTNLMVLYSKGLNR